MSRPDTAYSAVWRGLAVGALLLTGACARHEAFPPAEPQATFKAEAAGFDSLPGWETDAVEQALPALRRSCAVFSRKPPDMAVGAGALARPAADWQRACARLPEKADAAALRAALGEAFTPYRVTAPDGAAEGLFTGYYEAELKGSMFSSLYFPYPVYGRPIDLVERVQDGRKLTGRLKDGRVVPYPARAEIESGAIAKVAPVLFWVDDLVDLHVAQIQGSSRVILPDGRRFRIGYAGNNGRPFKGLGRILLDAKLIEPGHASMPEIRAWLHAYPRQAERLMQENPRFIFFRLIDGEGPVGALGVPLTPRRSLAVDPAVVPLGAPVWLDSVDPDGKPLSRLMVAQDIGSAIKGAVRGDFFWGAGEAALAKAGRMKSPGRYFVLLPAAAPAVADAAPAS
ncbi:MAG: murein transglycosylase A [Rhodospirillaceae bacterium]